MIPIQFGDIPLPANQAQLSLPVEATHETIQGVGVRAGAYDLWGDSSPLVEQQASYSFTFTGGERGRRRRCEAHGGPAGRDTRAHV